MVRLQEKGIALNEENIEPKDLTMFGILMGTISYDRTALKSTVASMGKHKYSPN